MSLQPPSVLLMGAPGSGKTDSLITTIEAGLELFVISTEPRGIESLIDSVQRRKLDMEKLHYVSVNPTRPGFEKLITQAKLVSISDQKMLANLPPSGGRSEAQWIKLLLTFNDFVDERTGKSFGPTNKFGIDKCIALDSFSGCNIMSQDITVGDKILMNQGEWQIAMNQLNKFVQQLCSDLNCFFIMTAHTEPEIDPSTGISKVMVSTLGKRLAPVIPRWFSDVVLAERIAMGDKETFKWNNAAPGYDLKRRTLPLSSNLDPSFKPIVDAYVARAKLVQPGKVA